MPILEGEQLEQVIIALDFFRIPIRQIANYCNLNTESLLEDYKHCLNLNSELDENTAVENTVFRLSMSGNHQCALAWLKNKAGWDDGKSLEREKERNATKQVTFEKIEVSVITDEEVAEILENDEKEFKES